jgi:hypothetical protein
MLPHYAPAPQSPRRFGVGIDTSRYGHYAAFLRDDLQPARRVKLLSPIAIGPADGACGSAATRHLGA